MRNKLEALLKEELRALAIKTRDHLNLTQREMSERLEMSESSYSDIETVVSMCGTLTTTLLLSEQDDPKACLQSFKTKFKEQYEKGV